MHERSDDRADDRETAPPGRHRGRGAVALALAGAAALALGLGADALGIGQPGFGEKQVALLLVGVFLLGVAFFRRGKAQDRRPPGDGAPGRSALARIRAAYTGAAVALLNTALLLVALNFLLALGFWVTDRAGLTRAPVHRGGLLGDLALLRLAREVATRAPIPGTVSPLALPDERLAEIYPGWSRKDVAALLDETRGRLMGYQPFSQFGEQPFEGRFVKVSEHGFRLGPGSQPWPMEAEAANVWVFGGSTTFGYGLPDGETIPAFLYQAFGEHEGAPEPRVYNFGQGYFYSSQELALFYRLLRDSPSAPRLAIFIDGINEHFDEPFFSHSLRTFMSAPYRAPYIRPRAVSSADAERVVRRWLRNRELIRAWARAHGIATLFVWQPAPDWGYDLRFHPFESPEGAERGSEQPIFGDSARYRRLSELRSRQDLGPDILWLGDLQRNSREPLYVDRLHYTARFCERIAAEIARQVDEQGWLEPAAETASTEEASIPSGSPASQP